MHSAILQLRGLFHRVGSHSPIVQGIFFYLVSLCSDRFGQPKAKKVGGVPSAMPPILLQGSDTICPECGLKDDGSPMIGKVWSHQLVQCDR